MDAFFQALAKRWTHPTKITVTGAWAAAAWDVHRPTQDIDCEVGGLSNEQLADFDRAADAAGKEAGILLQYSTDIDRWSQITMLDYRESAQPWKRFGSINIYVLDPLHWSIGKIGRGINKDIDDLVNVFKRVQPDPAAVAMIWRKALEASPRSSQLWLTKQQALGFFRQHGRKIWGEQFSLKRVEQILK